MLLLVFREQEIPIHLTSDAVHIEGFISCIG